MNVSTSTFLTKRRTLLRENDIEEENSASLKLGDEFQLKQINHQGEVEDLMALNLSEARLVIREALQERKRFFSQSNSIKDEDQNDLNDETLFGNQQSVEQELQNIDKTLEYSTMGHTKKDNSSSSSSSSSDSNSTGGNGNQALKQTLIYLANFSRFRDPETVTAVAQLLRSASITMNTQNSNNAQNNAQSIHHMHNSNVQNVQDIHPFEIAQLGSISCEDADEAKTLIPSLTNKISDDDLERILKELNNLETMY